MERGQLSPELKSEYDFQVKRSRLVWWQYTGLLLVGLLIATIADSVIEDNKKLASYVNDPKAGDVCLYKPEGGGYTTFRILEVSRDSIFILQNNYMSDKYVSINRLDQDTCYSLFQYFLSKNEYLSLYDEGHISDIDRH